MKQNNRKKAAWIFAVTFLIVLAVLAAAMLKTSAYNHTRHHADLAGTAVFSERGAQAEGISVTAAPRGSTWTKVFDLYDEGLTEHNYQAFTYDFTFANKTKDEVSDFVFRLGFRHDAFLSSAWNGSLEIHQNTASGEAAEDIPLIARMICVADSFDAMNTNRVYRNKLSKERIIEEIETNKGRQFDPQIADVFLRLLREDKLPLEA